MKIVKPKASAFLTEFRALPQPKHEETPRLVHLRGSLMAPLLLLCEHPTQEELNLQAPFVGLAAQSYALIMEQAGFNVEKDFLIVPFSRFGEKPSKASTEATLPFLQKHLPPHIRCVVCIGMAAFGFTFAGGRKTHAQTILGNPMYIPRLRTLPVYVLPDSTLLLDASSDDYRARNKAAEKAEFIFNLTLNLRKFCQTKLNLFN